jgi:hypothetical protein
MAESRYEFVLRERHRYAGWASTRKVVEMAGVPVEELAGRLRPWALAVITGEELEDGEYLAQLVELRGDRRLPLETEDVFWFYGEEYAPVSPARASRA